jgi:MlaC protein
MAGSRREVVWSKYPEAGAPIEQKHQADWRVHDLLIDGGSMVTNFRTQFDRVIRQESYAELVQRLEHSALSVDKAN